jgi:TonB-linked SusC/RagA family outer membrane protein
MYKKFTRFFCMPPGYTSKFLLIMKLTTFILLVTLLQVSAAGLAQKITYVHKNVSLKQVFDEINKQTGYSIIWTAQNVKSDQVIDADFKNTPVTEVLDKCLENQPLTYSIDDKIIVIRQKDPTIPDKIKSAFNIPTDIHGTVVDTIGQPIVGASITLKGTNYGAQTDTKGNFIFSGVPQGTYILIITYIGYEKLERTVENNGQNLNLKFTLHQGSSQLDQVQVIAYGQTTQRFNVGNIAQVTAAEIEEQPVTNPLQALEGRVPGLVVTQSSGVPGASVNIQIQGQNSLRPSVTNNGYPVFDQPLFIIDGVPYAPQNSNIQQTTSIISGNNTANEIGAPGGVSPFNSINPSDIESIEVLKDADATAIYGSRGANGVILITTKRGKAGKATVSGNIWSGESQVTNTMPMMNTQQYVQMREEALKNDGITPTVGNAPDLLVYDTTKNTNWEKYLLGGTAHTTDANASVSGGTQNDQFLIGTGYHHESYIYPGDFGDDRASFNVNLHHNSTDKKLTLDFSANYTYDKNDASSNTNVLSAFTLPPDYPALLNPNGTLDWNYKGIDLSKNPLAYLMQPYSMTNYNLISHFQVSYQILPGLSIRSSFGYNNFNSNEYSATPAGTQNPASYYAPSGSASFNTNNFQSWIIEPQAEYKKSISDGKLDVLLGGTLQQQTNNLTSINGSNYTNDLLLNSITAAGITTSTGSYSLYKYSALFGRINYIWQSKYIIDITANRDGSSRFGPGNQFGNFGSVGGGWLFSEEQFIKNALPFLSYGKLKASYGTTGNDNIGNYQYLSAYAPIKNNSYQGSVGYAPQNLYNPDYSWAVTKKFETGLELGILNDRVILEADWFRNISSNQLVQYTLPSQTGFTDVTENAPYTVLNTAFEIQLSSTNIKTTQFKWTTAFNITIPKNELLSFPGIANSSYAYYYVVGQSLTVLQDLKYLGVNPSTGLYQFEGANGIPTSNPNLGTAKEGGDYQVIGNLDPKFYGGLENSFRYKNFQLDIFLQFTKQLGANYFEQLYTSYPAGYKSFNLPVTFLSAWQKAGDQSNIQKLSTQFGSAYTTQGDFFNSSGAYSDASFIRFKTISLSYNLPQGFLKEIGVQGCKVYINAQNLFTITDYLGNDPENQNFYGLPPLKTIVAGVQFTF